MRIVLSIMIMFREMLKMYMGRSEVKGEMYLIVMILKMKLLWERILVLRVPAT